MIFYILSKFARSSLGFNSLKLGLKGLGILVSFSTNPSYYLILGVFNYCIISYVGSKNECKVAINYPSK